MSPAFQFQLAWHPTTLMYVDFETDGTEVTNYAVVLIVEHDGALTNVRVYDAAHGFNEMHRHTRAGGKAAGERFHEGTLGEGMRAAIDEIRSNYAEMIEAWRQ